MPRAPRKCLDCDTRVVGKSRCSEHERPAWAGSERGKETGTARWRKLRKAILERDRGICYLCGQPGADTVDHRVPKSQGGSDDPGNLGAVHDRNPPHCHRTKSGREGHADRVRSARRP